jgi:hypothetical protein
VQFAGDKEFMNLSVKKTAASFLKGVSVLSKGGIDLFTGIARVSDFVRYARLEFVPRNDDIFLVTYPRSGTTWMQMILYQLTTDGNMDFPHICHVSPWFERFLAMDVMGAEGLENFPSPRIFKTHLSYGWIPKAPCKYIYVVRDGKDVAVSYYHFYVSHLFFRGGFSDFFDHYFMKGKVQYGLWFRHVSEWLENKDRLELLILRYEDLVKDMEECLHKIISFCGLEIPAERFPEIMERCRFDFMKQHEEKFDHITGMIWEKGYKKNSFLRKGQTGGGKLALTPEQEKVFDQCADKYGGIR